jgi:hypothetical protein
MPYAQADSLDGFGITDFTLFGLFPGQAEANYGVVGANS